MGLDPERCLCGTHVHTGTKIIAIFNVSFAILGLLGSMTKYSEDPNMTASRAIVGLFVQFLVIGFHSLLLYGNLNRRSAYYVPYMVLQLISCIILIACSILYICLDIFFIVLVIVGKSSKGSAGKYGEYLPGAEAAPVIFLVLTLIIVFVTWLCCYLLSIVYRDHQLVKCGQLYESPRQQEQHKA